MCNIGMIWVQLPTNYLSVFDHLVELALKGIKLTIKALNKVHARSCSSFIVQLNRYLPNSYTIPFGRWLSFLSKQC